MAKIKLVVLFLLGGFLIGIGLVAAVILAMELLLGGPSPWTYWQQNEQILVTLLALPIGILVARLVLREKSNDQKPK